MDQSDFDFFIPTDAETYMELNIHIYVRGTLLAHDDSALDAADNTTVVNNLLYFLFSQGSNNFN